jgi:acetoin:2,6-dichlorophenolindophenol oxidoreductase subunit alpha
MHIADFDRGMLGANGVAAGGVPLAVGAALSAKIRGTGQVAVAFVGDGGANQGAFAESLTLAAVWRLPVVFVVENNGYAQATGTPFHLNGRTVAPRGEALGIPSTTVDGYDYFAVRAAADQAVTRARTGGGPSLLECTAQRFFGHMEGWDQQAYRGDGEVDRLRAGHDSIRSFAEQSLATGALTGEEIAELDRSVSELVDEAVRTAESAAEPDLDEVLTDVYVSY